MTKFIRLQKQSAAVKPTVFTHCITAVREIIEVTNDTPEDYSMVIHIGYDSCYGDVFKAIKRGESADFALYFGRKGDEYYEPIQ